MGPCVPDALQCRFSAGASGGGGADAAQRGQGKVAPHLNLWSAEWHLHWRKLRASASAGTSAGGGGGGAAGGAAGWGRAGELVSLLQVMLAQASTTCYLTR
jgi:hypothetical protein